MTPPATFFITCMEAIVVFPPTDLARLNNGGLPVDSVYINLPGDSLLVWDRLTGEVREHWPPARRRVRFLGAFKTAFRKDQSCQLNR